MDKKKDQQIYFDLDRRTWSHDHSLSRKKTIHTRILKLSAPEADASCGIIGRALSLSGQLQKSLIPLKKALIINPKNAAIQIWLVDSFLKLGKVNEGFFTLQKAISISPKEPSLHSFLIKLLKDGNQLTNLLSFYQKIAAMMDNVMQTIEMYLGSIEALEKFGMFSQALELYKKISETPAIIYMRIEYYFRYANALVHEGFLQEALIYYKSAEKYKGTKSLVINKMASVYYELGRNGEAFAALKSLIKGGYQTSTIYLNLMLVIEELGQDEKMVKEERDLVEHYIQGNRQEMQQQYQSELMRTEKKLEGNLSEKTREFYAKKLNALNRMAPLLTSPQQ